MYWASLWELFVHIPFYAFAIFAFFNKNPHIRWPCAIYSTITIIFTCINVCSQLLAHTQRLSIFAVCFINSPWLLIPLVLMARCVFDQNMFDEQFWQKNKPMWSSDGAPVNDLLRRHSVRSHPNKLAEITFIWHTEERIHTCTHTHFFWAHTGICISSWLWFLLKVQNLILWYRYSCKLCAMAPVKVPLQVSTGILWIMCKLYYCMMVSKCHETLVNLLMEFHDNRIVSVSQRLLQSVHSQSTTKAAMKWSSQASPESNPFSRRTRVHTSWSGGFLKSGVLVTTLEMVMVTAGMWCVRLWDGVQTMDGDGLQWFSVDLLPLIHLRLWDILFPHRCPFLFPERHRYDHCWRFGPSQQPWGPRASTNCSPTVQETPADEYIQMGWWWRIGMDVDTMRTYSVLLVIWFDCILCDWAAVALFLNNDRIGNGLLSLIDIKVVMNTWMAHDTLCILGLGHSGLRQQWILLY